MKYRRGYVPDPSRSQRAVRERAEKFIADRIAQGVRPESIDREVDIAFRASRLDPDEARFLRSVRQVLGNPDSRPLYTEPELPFREMRQRELALEAEIHMSKYSSPS